MIRIRLRLLAALAVAGLTVAGCQADPGPPSSSPGTRPTAANTCPELAARIVDAVQEYVDSFAGVTASGIDQSVTQHRAEFTATTTALRSRASVLNCQSDQLASQVRTELGRLKGGTPVQDAVAETFRADPLGGVDPSDSPPATVSVATAEGLVKALSSAGSGSTIRLAAGTYDFVGPLTLLRPVTLIGAGGDETTITSSAAGSAVVFAADGDVTLQDLTVRHVGTQPASVVAIAAGGYRIERTRVQGGQESDGAGGYGIIVRPVANPLTGSGTGAARTLTDVTVTDNTGGGIVVAGQERPIITRPVVEGTDGCGLCFVADAGGVVTEARISRARIGVQIDDAAEPTVTGAAIEESTVGVALTGTGAPHLIGLAITDPQIGVQVTGSGTATLSAGRVHGADEIGVRLSGTSRTTLTDLVVSGGTRVGVATLADATSTLTRGEVTTTGELGMVWGDQARGSVSELRVRGPYLGLQVAGTASVTVEDAMVDRSAGAAALLDGTGSGTFTNLGCGRGAGATIQQAATADLTLTASPTCMVSRR